MSRKQRDNIIVTKEERNAQRNVPQGLYNKLQRPSLREQVESLAKANYDYCTENALLKDQLSSLILRIDRLEKEADAKDHQLDVKRLVLRL